MTFQVFLGSQDSPSQSRSTQPTGKSVLKLTPMVRFQTVQKSTEIRRNTQAKTPSKTPSKNTAPTTFGRNHLSALMSP